MFAIGMTWTACFGGSGELETVGPPTIVRTGLLLLLALAAAVAGGTPFEPVQLVVAPLLGAVVALLSELTRLLTLTPAVEGSR